MKIERPDGSSVSVELTPNGFRIELSFAKTARAPRTPEEAAADLFEALDALPRPARVPALAPDPHPKLTLHQGGKAGTK